MVMVICAVICAGCFGVFIADENYGWAALAALATIVILWTDR